jgi:hypothetical protein
MVGLLQAPRGTRLYQRLEEQGRIRGACDRDNVEGTTNIVPAMDPNRLYTGYKEILGHIYSPRNYYQRVKTFLRNYRAPRVRSSVALNEFLALFRSMFRLGVLGKERREYWRLVGWTMVRRPMLLPLAVTLAITGYHFRRVCELHVR